jgi:hypothetical protein
MYFATTVFTMTSRRRSLHKPITESQLSSSFRLTRCFARFLCIYIFGIIQDILLSCCRTVPLPHSPTALLLHSPTALLLHSPTALLPHCPNDPMTHFPDDQAAHSLSVPLLCCLSIAQLSCLSFPLPASSLPSITIIPLSHYIQCKECPLAPLLFCPTPLLPNRSNIYTVPRYPLSHYLH